MSNKTEKSPHTATTEQTAARLRRTLTCSAIILFAATWKLWTPQTEFPQIPFFRWGRETPGWCDWVGLVVILVALLVALLSRQASRWWRRGLLVFVLALIGMTLLDQHRLQAWSYQFALIALVLALARSDRGLSLIRLLTIGIYFHSALSKLDYSFFETHGQYLVSGLADLAGIAFRDWEPATRRAVAAGLPIGELLIAVALCFRKTRLFGLIGGLFMHVALIVALGPWALDHEIGVMLWNIYFIVQNLLLFSSASPPSDSSDVPARRATNGVASVAVGLAVLFPFLEPWGLYDVWPSWALYAARPARVKVLITGEARDRLPAELTAHVLPTRFVDSLCPLRIERWSLAATNAPISPQTRFELGVALALAEKYELADEITLEIESLADRRTGIRTVRKISGLGEIHREADRFWLNTQTRVVANRND